MGHPGVQQHQQNAYVTQDPYGMNPHQYQQQGSSNMSFKSKALEKEDDTSPIGANIYNYMSNPNYKFQ